MANDKETIIITNNLNNPGMKVLLLFSSNNSKIGQAILLINLEEREAVLKSIFIKEKYRKQQYGSLLICKIFEVCHNNNVEGLILLSDPTNVTVGEFYEKLGFAYAWNRKVLDYDYEINIPTVIADKREFIEKWKNIKFKETFVELDKLKSIKNEQKLTVDGKILDSILDEALTLEESKPDFKQTDKKIADWFNQQREQIIKNPKQWWNSLTTEQIGWVRNGANIWWNKLTSEQRKLKLLEKQAQKKIEQDSVGISKQLHILQTQSLPIKSQNQDGMNDYLSEHTAQQKTNEEKNKEVKDDTSSLCDFDKSIKIKLEVLQETTQSVQTSNPIIEKNHI